MDSNSSGSNEGIIEVLYKTDGIVDDTDLETSTESKESIWPSLLLQMKKIEKVSRSDASSEGSGEICRKYVPVSATDVKNHPYYKFPAVSDPGCNEVLTGQEPQLEFDVDGVAQYSHLCKTLGVIPIKAMDEGLLQDTLDLGYYGFDPKNVRAIAAALTRNPHVTHLDLTDNKLSSDACYHLAEMLINNSTLKYIDMTGCMIGPEGAKRIAEGLDLNIALIGINLTYNNIGDEGFFYICQAIANNCQCSQFNFSHNKLGSRSAKLLIDAIPLKQELTVLDLSWNHFNTTVVVNQMLTTLANFNTTLEVLKMAWNDLFGDIIKGLANVVKIPSLRELNISNNRLSGESIATVLMRSCIKSQLNTLNLSCNPITPEEAYRIVSFMNRRSITIQNLHLDWICVNRDFKDLENLVKAKSFRSDAVITYGTVLNDYVIVPVDMKIITIRRAQALARSPKKKKKKKNFGYLINEAVEKGSNEASLDEFLEIIRKNLKMTKLDITLLTEMAKNFTGAKRGVVDLRKLNSFIKRLWPAGPPGPIPPPPKPPKVKKEKKPKQKKRKGKRAKAKIT